MKLPARPSPHPLSQDLDEVLERVPSAAWNELRGARLFIAGGTGFVGTWLLESFVWANRRLSLSSGATVLTRNLPRFTHRAPHLAEAPELEWLEADQANFAAPETSFRFIVHAANEDRGNLFRSNAEGTERLLGLAQKSPGCRLLFLSSGAVYGIQPPDLPALPETYTGALDPSSPNYEYAQSKRESEAAILASSADAVIARLFAFLGPHLATGANFAAGNFIRDVLRGGPVRVTGNGAPTRTYLYAADLAAWLWTLLLTAPARSIYNVGGSRQISIGELAHRVVAATGSPAQILVAEEPNPNVLPPRYVPDVARAAALGLHAWTSLDEGIRRWHRWLTAPPH